MAHSKATPWLDKVLAGQPEGVKARVWEIISRYDVDPSDEFFMIFTALGHLETLIESAPNDWRQVFTDFEAELKQWTSLHIRTLEMLARKAEAAEALATTASELTSTLNALTGVCSTFMTRFESSVPSSVSFMNEQRTLLNELTGHLLRLESKQNELLQRSTPGTQTANASTGQGWLLVLMLIGFCSLGYGQWLTRAQLETLRLQQLWQDCQLGLRARTSPPCKALTGGRRS